MNIYQITILFSLIVFIYSDCGDTQPSSKKDCWDSLSDKDKNIYFSAHCCYLKGRVDSVGDTGEFCLPITKNEYEDIKTYISMGEFRGSIIESFDCKTNYLNISLLILVIILF